MKLTPTQGLIKSLLDCTDQAAMDISEHVYDYVPDFDTELVTFKVLREQLVNVAIAEDIELDAE